MATSRVDRVIADLNTLLSLDDLVTPSGMDPAFDVAHGRVEILRKGPEMMLRVHMQRTYGEGGWWLYTSISFDFTAEDQEVREQLARAELFVYNENGDFVVGDRLSKTLGFIATLKAGSRFKLRLFASTIEDDEAQPRLAVTAVPSGGGWAPRVVGRRPRS